MTHPDQRSIDIARAIVDNARRLGLTWERVLATVEDPNAPTVTIDGDSVPVNAVPMIGPLLTNQRVYVDKVPPAANFIVGSVQPASGELVDYVSSVTATAAIGAEAVALTSNSIRWQAGCAYEVIVFHPAITGSVASNTAQRRVRKGTLVGTDLSDVTANQNHLTAGQGTTTLDRIIVRNATAVEVVSAIVCTLAASTGTVVSNANATRIRYMEVRYVGPASRYTNAVQI